MNREFSKGMRLYLSEYARVQSTFAGHYDLGAYLVVVLPLALAGLFGLREVKFRRTGCGTWPRHSFLLPGLGDFGSSLCRLLERPLLIFAGCGFSGFPLPH